MESTLSIIEIKMQEISRVAASTSAFTSYLMLPTTPPISYLQYLQREENVDGIITSAVGALPIDERDVCVELKRNLYEPSDEFKRVLIYEPKGNYMLNFPFELTNVDYARRIFQVVRDGIRERVVSVADKRGLRKPWVEDPKKSNDDVYFT